MSVGRQLSNARSSRVKGTTALLAAVLSLSLASSSSVLAGGAYTYEWGTQDAGRGVAGVAAIADTAATAFANPAGMTRLQGSQMIAGTQVIVYNAEFETASGTTFAGGDGGNAGTVLPATGLYYVHDVSPDFKVGVSAVSWFGAGLDYGENWAGRYYVRHVDLLTAGVEPTAAVRVNDWLSVGGGVGLVVGRWDQDAAINNLAPGRADGTLVIDGWATGAVGSLGVLVEPSARTRFGLTYISPAELEFDDVVDFRGLGPLLNAALTRTGALGAEVDIEITLPQQVMLSAYHRLTDRLELMANLGWQDWSEFGLPTLTVNSSTTRSVVADRNYDDTHHVAIGARYTLDDDWRVSTGFAYDSSPVDAASRTPDFPVDRQLRFSLGIDRRWGDDARLSLTYTYMDGGDAEIRQSGGPLRGSLVGDYDRNEIHFLGLNLDWRF